MLQSEPANDLRRRIMFPYADGSDEPSVIGRDDSMMWYHKVLAFPHATSATKTFDCIAKMFVLDKTLQLKTSSVSQTYA